MKFQLPVGRFLIHFTEELGTTQFRLNFFHVGDRVIICAKGLVYVASVQNDADGAIRLGNKAWSRQLGFKFINWLRFDDALLQHILDHQSYP